MIKSQKGKILCPVCQHIVEVKAEIQEGDTLECPNCLIEMDVKKKDSDGEITIE